MADVRSALAAFSLKDRAVLLTGASAGLGREFAKVLAGAGAQVVAVARREDELAALAAEVPGVHPLPADLGRSADVPEIVATAVDLVGPIDVLVNNAAYIAGGVKAEDESLDLITTTLAVNLVAPMLLAQQVFPSMRERGRGSIVNVTSIVATAGIGRFPQAAYAASKGGLESITREWAAQWSRYGIRINALAPGWFDSEMTHEVTHQPKVQDWILRNTLLPRHGETADFAGALLFLASDASAYVTGQTLIVDGGWTAH